MPHNGVVETDLHYDVWSGLLYCRFGSLHRFVRVLTYLPASELGNLTDQVHCPMAEKCRTTVVAQASI